MKKQTGIWLDLRGAWMISLPTMEDADVEMQHVSSKIDENGSRGENSSNAQDGDNDSHRDERRHHEEDHYFEAIVALIQPDTDELVIFGPSKAKFGLQNLLEKQHHAPKIKGVEGADQMTENQMKAWVLDFFGRSALREQAE
jgi:hypothetical protein